MICFDYITEGGVHSSHHLLAGRLDNQMLALKDHEAAFAHAPFAPSSKKNKME